MRARILISLAFLALLLAGCKASATPTQTGQPAASSPTSPAQPVGATPAAESATPTALPATPTPTPPPPAMTVNGEIVPLAEYQASLEQLNQADPQGDPADHKKRVLNELSDETLLAQAAFQGGFSLDDAALDQRIAALAQKAGGDAALQDWEKRMGYTPESFRSALRRAAAAAWQRDQVAASVPAEAEQVHARQILVHSQDQADLALTRAKQAGTDFATLAFGYDLAAGGDLAWFPRGYLNEKAVEDAAFSLQPGEISAIVKTDLGYHILQVIARAVRPLTPDARAVLQRKALASFLENSRAQSKVEFLVP